MGVSYTGKFAQLKTKTISSKLAAPPVDPGANGFAFFPFASDVNPQYGDYVVEYMGTPTFEAPPNAGVAATGREVIKIDRAGEHLLVNGDFSFLAGDFSIQFWMYFPTSGAGNNGDIVINCGPVTMRANSGIGNAYGDFDLFYRDGTSTFRSTMPLRADSGYWNHITISKQTSNSIANGWTGTRFGWLKNGQGQTNVLNRSNGKSTTSGSSVSATFTVNPNPATIPSLMYIGGTDSNAGVALHMSGLKFYDKSLINMYNPYLTYFVPQDWDVFC